MYYELVLIEATVRGNWATSKRLNRNTICGTRVLDWGRHLYGKAPEINLLNAPEHVNADSVVFTKADVVDLLRRLRAVRSLLMSYVTEYTFCRQDRVDCFYDVLEDELNATIDLSNTAGDAIPLVESDVVIRAAGARQALEYWLPDVGGEEPTEEECPLRGWLSEWADREGRDLDDIEKYNSSYITEWLEVLSALERLDLNELEDGVCAVMFKLEPDEMI